MRIFGYNLPNMSSLILWGLLWEFVGQIELTFFLPPLSAIFSTLMEIGFSGQSLFQTLLLFNVGIELAQLSLLPIIFLLVFLFSKMNLRNEFKKVSAFVIGGISSYWFIERTLNLFIA